MNEVDSILNNWFGEPPEHSDNERAQLKFLYEPLRKIERQRDQLLEALKIALHQNEHDMVMTGEECRKCQAAIKEVEQ